MKTMPANSVFPRPKDSHVAWMFPEASGRKCLSPCWDRAVTTPKTPMALGLGPKIQTQRKVPQ